MMPIETITKASRVPMLTISSRMPGGTSAAARPSATITTMVMT